MVDSFLTTLTLTVLVTLTTCMRFPHHVLQILSHYAHHNVFVVRLVDSFLTIFNLWLVWLVDSFLTTFMVAGLFVEPPHSLCRLSHDYIMNLDLGFGHCLAPYWAAWPSLPMVTNPEANEFRTPVSGMRIASGLAQAQAPWPLCPELGPLQRRKHSVPGAVVGRSFGTLDWALPQPRIHTQLNTCLRLRALQNLKKLSFSLSSFFVVSSSYTFNLCRFFILSSPLNPLRFLVLHIIHLRRFFVLRLDVPQQTGRQQQQ